MLKEEPFLFRVFFSNGSPRQAHSSFVKPAEKNWANGLVFFVSISEFEEK